MEVSYSNRGLMADSIVRVVRDQIIQNSASHDCFSPNSSSDLIQKRRVYLVIVTGKYRAYAM